jgi:SAM-dependent methyltransferase
MVCPVCESSDCCIHHNLYDDRYGYPGEFHLNKCSECGHRFLGIEFDVIVLNKLYTSYYPRALLSIDKFRPRKEEKGFLSWLNGSHRSAYCWVPAGVRVLDIGCGFGETLAYHSARGCDAYGVEVDENIRRVAERFGFKVHVGPFDPDIYEPDFFDFVTMDQVLEHVIDPLETLRGIERILKPNGKAIISMPNSSGWGARLFGRRWINWHAPYHLHHFSIGSMKIALGKSGLGLEKVITITSSEWLFYQWVHAVLYPCMGTPSAFWSPNRNKTFLEKLWIKVMTAAHRTKINHLVTRFFDCTGSGDNLLFFLRKESR